MSRASFASFSIAIVASVVLASAHAHAQVRASERSTLSQTVDGAEITLSYARPNARGRDSIFYKTVTVGETWTPGANNATTLQVSRAIKIDGHDIAKGKYSVWFVVRPTEWTVVLDPKFDRYHTEPPDSTAGQVRWQITPQNAQSSTEILTFSFPDVRFDGATLRFAWGNKQATFNVTVTPRYPLLTAEALAKPYVGKYRLQWTGSDSVRRDTVELYYEEGALKQRYSPAPDFYPRLQNAPMSRIAAAQFIPAIFRDGKIWEMVADMVFRFKTVNGAIAGFDLVSDTGELQARGTRLKAK